MENNIQIKDKEISALKNKISEIEKKQKESTNNDEKNKKLDTENKDMNEQIKKLKKDLNELDKKYKNITKEKEKLLKEKQNLEKDNKKLKNNIMINSMNGNQIKKSNIMESQIFMDDISNKNKNKSLSPFVLPGQSLKGSIMPLGDFEQIREENEEEEDNKNTNGNTDINTNNIITKKDSDEIGSNYMGDENEDEEKIKKDFIKEKKKKIKQSRLKMSLKSNIFDFTDEKDENYTNDLKNEINDLYKKEIEWKMIFN
jgi:hypothetical protein